MALGGFFISGSVVGLQGLRCRGFLLDVPFGLCVRERIVFLWGPGTACLGGSLAHAARGYPCQSAGADQSTCRGQEIA